MQLDDLHVQSIAYLQLQIRVSTRATTENNCRSVDTNPPEGEGPCGESRAV
jgi:hypothetical protein